MAIYRSSFNQRPEKPEKPEKPKKERAEKPKREPKKLNVNHNAIWITVFSVLFIVCCLPSNFVKSFLLGMIGLSIYPLLILGITLFVLRMKKFKFKEKFKFVTYITVALILTWLIFHLILTSKISTASYWEYLKQTYLAKTTAGGLLFSLLSYPMIKVLTVVGAYIFSAIGLAIFVGLIADYLLVEKKMSQVEKKTKFDFAALNDLPFEEELEKPIKAEDTKRNAKQKLGLEKGEATILSSTMPKYNLEDFEKQKFSKKDYILTPLNPVLPTEDTQDIFTPIPKKSYRYEKINKPQKTNFDNDEVEEVVKPQTLETINLKQPEVSREPEPAKYTYEEPEVEAEPEDDFMMEEDVSGYETAFVTSAEIDELEDLNDEVKTERIESTILQPHNEQPAFEQPKYEQPKYEEPEAEEEEEYVDEYQTQVDNSYLGSTVETEVVLPSVDISKFNIPTAIKKPVGEQPKEEIEPQKLDIPPYVAPPVELLNYLENPVRISDDELQDNIIRLEQVLEDFKVPAKVNNVQVGPAVTRYELTMPRGISVNKIAQMADDIAMTLASNGSIRVEAPIPGKNSVGVEVPNAQVSPVSLRELIDSDEFKNRGNPLSFVLGKDINGSIMFCNLDKMPHVLVAGSTGSGKSVCLNTMLLSMCYKAGPQDLRLILVDPKMVEFSTYNGLPHLLIPEVIIGKDMTINALDWAVKEMERRYALFAKNHVVNINEFNKLEIVKSKRESKLPYIVIVVDELADLMLEAKREIEDRIAKLAAKARAAGIHLVLATQRPSVDVITGTVKANLPSRIAFALTNYMDSKTVLDGGGAEKLLGKGDMLFKPQDKPEPTRIQGAFVSNAEIAKVVEFIKENNRPVYDENAGRAIKNPQQDRAQAASNARDVEFDPVLKEALRMFIQTKQASASMISRRYSVGFNRAGRIMDQMEMAGFIGPQEGAKPRTVLITMDEYNAIFGEEN